MYIVLHLISIKALSLSSLQLDNVSIKPDWAQNKGSLICHCGYEILSHLNISRLNLLRVWGRSWPPATSVSYAASTFSIPSLVYMNHYQKPGLCIVLSEEFLSYWYQWFDKFNPFRPVSQCRSQLKSLVCQVFYLFNLLLLSGQVMLLA